MKEAWVKMEWDDGSEGYVRLEIQEVGQSGPVFKVWNKGQNGHQLLSADDVRANWNAWVGELIPDWRIADAPGDGLAVY